MSFTPNTFTFQCAISQKEVGDTIVSICNNAVLDGSTGLPVGFGAGPSGTMVALATINIPGVGVKTLPVLVPMVP